MDTILLFLNKQTQAKFSHLEAVTPALRLIFLGKIFSFGGYNPSIETDDEDMVDDEFWPESSPLFKEVSEWNTV